MKLILILIFSIHILSAKGQTESLKKKDSKSILSPSLKSKSAHIDTIPSIEYLKTNQTEVQPAYFIDGKLFNPTILKTIDPKLVDSIHVEKKEIKLREKKYYGQIFIKMKNEYNPRFISLSDLKLKYTKLTNSPTIFIIDNEIIKDDYSNYIVDEKYILKIIVDKIENEEENLYVQTLQLLTKKEENVKKSKEIRIRGTEIVKSS